MSPVDRYGEPIEEPPEGEQSPAPPADYGPCDCDNGWLDYVDADNPVPCPKCKPHLVGPHVHFH